MRVARTCVVALLVAAACKQAEPPADLELTVRQIALPGRVVIEIAVQPNELTIVTSARNIENGRKTIGITDAQYRKLRQLFWTAWRSQPETRHVPRLMDGLALEQSWKGPERMWQVSVKGQFTEQEYEAFDYLNTLLPQELKLGVDFGTRRRAKRGEPR